MGDDRDEKTDPLERVLREAFQRADSDGKRFMLDLEGRISELTAREHMWVQQLGACVADLTNESPDWRSLEIFWVRTHGLLVELCRHWEKANVLMNAAGANSTAVGIMRFVQLEALRAVRDVVVERERDVIAVDFYRQRACHMQQSKFRLQFDPRKGALQPETRKNPINGKTYTVKEMDEALAQVDEVTAARELAQRMRGPLGRLASRMTS